MNFVTYLENGQIRDVLSGLTNEEVKAKARGAKGLFLILEEQPDPFSNYVKDQEIVPIPKAPSNAHKWDWETKEWIISNEILMEKVRERRNKLLKESDFTQIEDAPGGQGRKNQWRQYRQSLRDLPQNHPDAYLLEHITWPTPPE